MTANGTAATAAGDPTLAAGPSPTGRRPVDAPATIGAWGNKGRGFAHPVDVAADPSSGTLCVLNRSTSWASPHGGAVRVTVVDPGRHEVLGEISRRGTGPGELMMPVGVAVDGRGRVLVTDEHTHTVSAFDLDGAFLARWGEEGGGPGQLRRPAGIAVDGDDVWVVDAGNSRLQRFGDDGRFRGHAGGPGCGPGQLHQPWFVAVGPDGDLWVGDWGNDRVQVLDRSGACRAVLGGGGGDLFLRPAGIAVTPAGWLHVADWGRDRLMVFDPDLRLEAIWFGDAGLSPWAAERLEEFPTMAEARRRARSPGLEPLLRRPTGLCALPGERVVVADTGRHRLQVYGPQHRG